MSRMDQNLVRAWLQLPPGDWPPDHYTLLGLERGESDVARIEERVLERMQILRHYQLTSPEAATEAMNRLAQALVCLTDPKARQAYDAQRDEKPAAPAEVASPARAPDQADPLAWLFGQWTPPTNGSAARLSAPPVAAGTSSAPTARDTMLAIPAETGVGEPVPTAAEPSAQSQAAPAPEPAPAESAPPASADNGPEAWARGLEARRALYVRVHRLRQLLTAWDRAGRYLNEPSRMITRPGEATDLIRQMTVIREMRRTLPPLGGDTVQPGDLVLNVARQQLIVPTLQTLLPSQRERLAKDWQDGRELLLSHRHFLLRALRAHRRRGPWRRTLRTVRAALAENLLILYFFVGLVALNLAFEEFRQPVMLLRQGLALAVLIVARFAWWRYSLRPVRLPPPPPRPAARKPRSSANIRRHPDSSRA
jgi:hypothetical protein